MPLTKHDFDYMTGWIKESEQEHQRKMVHKNMPNQVIAAYEGVLEKARDTASPDLDFDLINEGNDIQDLYENYLFIAVNTIWPSLFFQAPKPLIRADEGGEDYSAAIIQSMVRHYFPDQAKKENQMCILDAFMPYGYAVMKVGYNSRRGKLPSQKPNLFTGTTKGDETKEGMEASIDFLRYEKAYRERVSPMDAFLDHTKPWGKDQKITFRYKRTLQELMDSNLYALSSNFITHFKARGEGDERKVNLKLYEHWYMKDKFAWKFVYVEDWPEELIHGRSVYTELPRSLLRFNNTPDRLYCISHGNLMFKAQKELNYLNELWKRHIDGTRRQTFVDETALAEGGRATLEDNAIDGIVFTNRPVTQGVAAPIGNPPMSPDIFGNIENVRAYLNLLASTTGGKGGEPDTKLAITERSKALGDILRSAGLSDSIRDFVNDQNRKIVSHVVNFGNPLLTLTITKKNIIDPNTGQVITGQKIRFGGENGLELKSEIKGNVETDYQYDVDIASAARPDFAVIRKQLMDAISLSINLEPLMRQQGKTLDISSMIEEVFNTFDTIPNPSKFIREMTEDEKKQAQLQAQLAQQQEAIKTASKGNPSAPTESAILQGAQATPTGTEGLSLV